MNKQDYINKRKLDLVNICDLILSEKVNYVEACNSIMKIFHELDFKENSHWNVIRSIDDDFLDTPIGEAKKHFSKDFLEKTDQEISEFYPQIKQALFEACKYIKSSI